LKKQFKEIFMPSGCDFICNNEECEQYNNGFVITSAWPLGNVALIINGSEVKKNESFRASLIKLKNEGRKYACITLPNIEDIPVVGYRFNLWCAKCNCIWNHDVMSAGETIEDILSKKLLPEKCPKCDEPLKSFEDVVEDSIPCPHCNEELKQSRWFSNENAPEGKQKK